MLVQSRSQEPLYTTRAVSMLAQKQAIAQTTASLIQDGESIFLDLGTTTLDVLNCSVQGDRSLLDL